MNLQADFLNTRAGKFTIIAGILVAGAVVMYSMGGFLGESDAQRISARRMFICSETGKAFECDLEAGMQIPVMSPYSGKATGYPAEACYWTKDGKIKNDPTWVLLNEAIHKPGPTFCPDCGRLVVGHNAHPTTGDPAPPTETELRAQHGGIQ